MTRFLLLRAAALLLGFGVAQAAQAEAVVETILRVRTESGHDQLGVLSRIAQDPPPRTLLVLVSGHPGVTRPRPGAAGTVTTRQNGNFLVRVRHHLVSPLVATLLLDCRADFETVCPDAYQASADRAADIGHLVALIRRELPSITAVWAVSTSRGVITTAGLLAHAGAAYAGIIHTAGTYGKAQDQGLDFGPSATPQVIIHHADDPCPVTPHRDAALLARRWAIPLVTVAGGAGFRGDPCQAFTQHGFAGREAQVAGAIRRLVETGSRPPDRID